MVLGRRSSFSHQAQEDESSTTYLKEKVAPVLKKLLTKVVEARPDDVAAFMYNELSASTRCRQSFTAEDGRTYPLSPQEVSCDWLGEVFGETVVSFKMNFENMDAGVLGDAFRVFDIKYANPSSSNPKSVFLKCSKALESTADLASTTFVYFKECYFYEHLSRPDFPLKHPKNYGVFYEKDDPLRRKNCLVMEDIAGDWVPMTRTNPATMAVLIEDLSTFHAEFWGTFPVKKDVPGFGAPQDHFHSLAAMQPDTWGPLQVRWAEVYGEEFIRPGNPVDAHLKKLGDLLASKGGRFFTKTLEDWATRPRTMTHGDLRSNNLFQHRVTGELKYIDWQLWWAGSPALDFPQAFGIAGVDYEGEEGAKLMMKFIRDYYAGLCRKVGEAQIKREYPFETFVTDIKIAFATFTALFITFSLSSLDDYSKPENKKAGELWQNWMRNHFAVLHALGVAGAVETYMESL